MTRGNVYIHDTFVAEVPSDAYPEGDFWKFMEQMNKSQVTQKEFKDTVTDHIREWGGSERLPPQSRGVGNWSYEFMWVATQPTVEYREWESWRGVILVRTWNMDIAPGSYYQVPGPWQKIEEFKRE